MDRNYAQAQLVNGVQKSLSARRAWIEILISARQVCLIWSLSARRAWIEIEAPSSAPYAELVALRKESVDRNFRHHNLNLPSSPSLSARRAWIEIMDDLEPSKTRRCRSPQGERG